MLSILQEFRFLGTISTIRSILELLKNNSMSKSGIIKYCSNKNSDLLLSSEGAIALLISLGILTQKNYNLFISNVDKNAWLFDFDDKEFAMNLSQKIMNKLIQENELSHFIKLDKIKFDYYHNCLSIEVNSFSLQNSSLRNLLISIKSLYFDPSFPHLILFSNGFQQLFESQLLPEFIENKKEQVIKKISKKMSLEQLLALQEIQSESGIQAEEFVLKYEFNRLFNNPKKELVKRISDIDVNAGYDIVSFDDDNSIDFDRFIEVKSYIGIPEFYWSENEVKISQQKRERYFLYLVNRNFINDTSYVPRIIQDPYINIFENKKWFKETEKWRVKELLL